MEFDRFDKMLHGWVEGAIDATMPRQAIVTRTGDTGVWVRFTPVDASVPESWFPSTVAGVPAGTAGWVHPLPGGKGRFIVDAAPLVSPHNHAIADVTGLQSSLDAKQDAAAVPEIVRDTIGAALLGGTGVTISVNDGADTITVNINTFAWLENTPRNVQTSASTSLRVAPNAGSSEIVLLGAGTPCLRFYAAWMSWSYVWTNGYGFGWIDTTKLTSI